MRRELEEYRNKTAYVIDYVSDSNNTDGVIEDVYNRYWSRVQRVRDAGVEALSDEAYIIVVINSIDAIRNLSNNADAMKKYKEMASQAQDMRVFFLLADVPNEAVPYSGPELLKFVRDRRECMLFDNVAEQKFAEVSVVQQRIFRAPLEEGQAFVCTGPDIDKVRFAMSE
jgi:hypothetical protein